VDVEMSDFQFGQYEEARVNERKLELNNSRKRKKGPKRTMYWMNLYPRIVSFLEHFVILCFQNLIF